ncbi:MAG: protein-glutamate O-methyltransferase CheR [Pseudomonadota bacterium]
MSTAAQTSDQLDPASFRAIADLAYAVSGLTLVEEKSSMIRSRLRPRLKALKLTDFKSYTAYLASDAGKPEQVHLISALTTNVSHFFREPHHFDTLRDLLTARLPALRSGGKLRIWSAGSSNGQEALSTAITLHEAAGDIDKLDVKILGTDIDTQVVKFARAGVYPERLMGGVPDALVPKYFDRVDIGSPEPHFEAKPKLKQMIHFNPLNLLGSWPMNKPFDAIFCRNVVIYFDQKTQRDLWPRFRAQLHPKGVFFMGHSERIADPETFGFDCTGPTTYQHINRS